MARPPRAMWIAAGSVQIIRREQSTGQGHAGNPWENRLPDLPVDSDLRCLIVGRTHLRHCRLLAGPVRSFSIGASFGFGYASSRSESDDREASNQQGGKKALVHDASPGRFRILPNSPSTGSISIRRAAAGLCGKAVRSGPGLGGTGKAGEGATAGLASGSLSGTSEFWPGMYHPERLSSQERYRESSTCRDRRRFQSRR